jgi:spermidine/putrescine transport system permease protein
MPLAWYGVLLIGPLILVLATSLANRGMYGGIDWTFTFDSFANAFDPIYSLVLSRSFMLAALTTLLCFCIGLPVALAMATATPGQRQVYVFALAIPFLTNLMIRICALKSLLAYDGPVAEILSALGFAVDRFALSQNRPLVLYGMISSYLPFMVFPLYGALERFDFSLVEAAQDLGANYWQVLMRVIVPSLRRAVVSGVLLVFIPSFGEFVIPDLLGGAKAMLIGNLISEQFLKSRDWPFGSALSVLLMIVLAFMIFVIRSFERPRGQKEKS